jgi:asparagine synthase (glutamine-hydrolysing)
MCGIVGYFGEFTREQLAAADRLQAHRGPDGQGTWFSTAASVGLAHRRLSILDLSPTGAQPMLSEDRAVVLVFNGEIYNFRELRSELEGRGHQFRGGSDTEVLLHLYLEHGTSFLSRLNGIFSFAFWDERDKSLFVARDGLGVKPLYYCEVDTGFAFASELKALIRLAPTTRTLDASSLHRYLTFLWCPGDGTPFKAIRKLTPGEALVVREGKVARRWTWYRLPAFRGVTPDLTESDAISGTEHSLRRAVHRQMVADVPVGAFLSGGLDSSSVVAFAREQASSIRCFTVESVGGQESGTTDDLPYARRVASHLGVPLEIIRVDASDMAADLQRMVAQLDEPLADPASLNVLYISQLARTHGVKVLLSGAGGDDLFTGYRRHMAVAYEYLWRWLPGSVRGALGRIAKGFDQRASLPRRIARSLSGAALDGDHRLAAHLAWARETDLHQLYTPEFHADLGQASAAAPMIDYLEDLPRTVSPLERMLALEQRFFLADHNLIYTDKMSMASGVEVRVPFLDLDLIEHAARIPPRMKQRGRVGKWVLKKAMEGHLPKDVIYRPKTGFGAPVRRWMRNDLRHLMADLLSVESLKRRGLFDPAAVQSLIARNAAGTIDAGYTLLALLCIEVWCRAYIDLPSHNPSAVSA